jgi:hypothetical protein
MCACLAGKAKGQAILLKKPRLPMSTPPMPFWPGKCRFCHRGRPADHYGHNAGAVFYIALVREDVKKNGKW